MARAKTNKLYRTFTKGLITEASPLTYPEEASIDELNTVISRKGNRTRRVGIDYQEGYVLEDLGIPENALINEYVWRSVNNDATFNFVVVQINNVIHFYRMDEGPTSANKQPFTIDLSSYLLPGVSGEELKQEFAQFSSGSGYMFIAHRLMIPLSVVYNKDTNNITVTPIQILVRDLEGIDDGLENDAEPTELSAAHHYNLLNQGWISPGDARVVGAGNPPDGGLSDVPALPQTPNTNIHLQ